MDATKFSIMCINKRDQTNNLDPLYLSSGFKKEKKYQYYAYYENEKKDGPANVHGVKIYSGQWIELYRDTNPQQKYTQKIYVNEGFTPTDESLNDPLLTNEIEYWSDIARKDLKYS